MLEIFKSLPLSDRYNWVTQNQHTLTRKQVAEIFEYATTHEAKSRFTKKELLQQLLNHLYNESYFKEMKETYEGRPLNMLEQVEKETQEVLQPILNKFRSRGKSKRIIQFHMTEAVMKLL